MQNDHNSLYGMLLICAVIWLLQTTLVTVSCDDLFSLKGYKFYMLKCQNIRITIEITISISDWVISLIIMSSQKENTQQKQHTDMNISMRYKYEYMHIPRKYLVHHGTYWWFSWFRNMTCIDTYRYTQDNGEIKTYENWFSSPVASRSFEYISLFLPTWSYPFT